MEMTLENIERLLQLMTSYKCDAIEIGELKLRKSRHFTEVKEDAQVQKEKIAEILFASSPGGKPPADFDLAKMLQDPFSSKE
jgi:hypothetical protein